MPSCANSTDQRDWVCQDHKGFDHAQSWDQVERWLERDLRVLDPDGDLVRKVDGVRAARPGQDVGTEIGSVRLTYYADPYEYSAMVMLLEEAPEPPVTQEEEDEAIASILRAAEKLNTRPN